MYVLQFYHSLHSVFGLLHKIKQRGKKTIRDYDQYKTSHNARGSGLADTFGESGPNEALLEKYGISVEKMTEAIRELVVSR